jgi:hypothetical protein
VLFQHNDIDTCSREEISSHHAGWTTANDAASCRDFRDCHV